MNPDVLQLLLGAGGAGGIAGVVTVWRTWRKGKLDDEETLIKRLNDDNKDKDATIERLNSQINKLTNQRNKVWSQAARFQRMLIVAPCVEENTIPELVEFDD